MSQEKLSQPKKRKINADREESNFKRTRRASSPLSNDENEVQVAGKITRIFMKNFMCHDAMEVNLNQRVNFIVGANGSGKSAILTALTVGLGARAKATSRGPSIREFIKKGKNSALIEISITNKGPMAYKYETYGDSITVMRSIGASSTYKIKNWRGDTVSTKRQELSNIINFLNIQVDNPISVLNQDVSRSFLVSSNSHDKYNLFMKATRLDVIGDNYREAIKSSETAHQQLSEAQKFLSENEKEINGLKKKLKALESLSQAREEFERLQNELHWAKVAEEEKKLLQVEGKIKQQESNMDKLKNLESTRIAKEQEIDLRIEEFKSEILEIESEAHNSNKKLNEIKIKYMDAKNVFDQKKENVKDLHLSIKRKENDIVTLKNEIKKLEREYSEAGDKRQQARQESAECEQQLDEVEATLRTKQTDLMHLEENKRRIEQEENRTRVEVDQKNLTLNKLTQRLNALKNQPNDALTVYGSNMPRLLKRIEEAYDKGKFRQKPLGPLGSFIKLKDSGWIPAIENHLGFSTLSCFCVDNSQDGRVLDIIMKEVFRNERQPQIVISKFFNKRHDVSRGCTQSSDYSNLLDAMEISHPVIANSLIDQKEIECILLIRSFDEACNVMSDANKVPRNCKRAITSNADLFYPDPNYRMYGGGVSRPRFLQVSTSEAMQSLQEEISVAQDKFDAAQKEYMDIRERKQKNRVELCQVQNQVKSLLQKQHQLRNRIDELKEVIESCNNNTINTFMTEVEELQRLVFQKKEEESRLIDDSRESKKNYEVLSREYASYRDLAQNVDARLNPIKEKIKELKEEKSRLKVSNQGATRRMEETKQHLQKLNGEHEQQQRVVNSKIELAEKACQRIDTRKSVADINSRSKELKTMIENVEKQHGKKDEITEELEEKMLKYKDVREFAIQLSISNDRHRKRLRDRKLFYNQMKKEISERVQHSFKNVLSLRNYKGKIVIDHQQKELVLEVAPVNDVRRATSDAKSLSGGERSYSTVAFILALWDSTGLPFYFLDEFDVFMDKVNRRVIMDILLGHAQSNPQSQFAFLTPLDTSHIVADNSITIHRLAAPERTT